MSDAVIRKQVERLGRPSVAMLDREIGRLDRNESYRRLLYGILAGLAVTAAAIILVTNLWVTVVRVDGSSMNPRLRMDDVVLAVKDNDPAKNSVIVFYLNNRLHIKRVIGTAGDLVDISEAGIVSVNGRTLDEPYVAEPSLGACDTKFPFQVPTGTVFVLGDNRAASMDSRDSQFGPVPREQIVGKVVCSVWPLKGAGKVL
ncbi:MAG: signal peptidase I [Oscillospiraceae bacterium]|nr:signal peptidase I [Oscillospiraceae bacterium]